MAAANVYQRLAAKLNALPQGFPATAAGVELKILRLIFSEQEAELALQMTVGPETAEDVAARLGRPAAETRARLDEMARKGQIGCAKKDGRHFYRFMPFVVGIYESQRGARLTRELAELFEEYAPYLGRSLGSRAPHLVRVIPVNAPIPARLAILPHEDLRRLFLQAKSFRVQDCTCRKQRALLGQPCRHPLRTCLHYSMEAQAYDYFNPEGDIISREAALEIALTAEKEGLVHATYNVKDMPHGFICNCCSCCCGFLRNLKKHPFPYILAGSSYTAQIDQDQCAACGLCRDERCPMDAIEEKDGGYRVLASRCIGCGLCVIACPSGAIAFAPRPEAERPAIAENLADWNKKRMESRSAPAAAPSAPPD